MSPSFDKDSSAGASSELLIQHHSRPQQLTPRPWSIPRVALFTVFVLVGSLELVVLETILVRWGQGNRCPQGPLLGELNDLVPRFPTTPVLFRKDALATIDRESEHGRNDTRANWLSYMPKGNGFIAVDNSAQYQLPDPIPFLGKSVYSLAVFHQLHCLYAIMDRYNDLTSDAPAGAHAGHGRRQEAHHHHHIDHCFRYLRQSLLCCGDTALEGQDPKTNGTGTDGTGAVHMCKDFETIRSWAENHRLVNNKHAL